MRLRIITIQEKGKNIYQGKRIIPLTNKAIQLIQTFNSIKQKYNIESNSPVLITYKDNLKIEKKISKKNVNEYFFNLIKKETNSIPQNELRNSISEVMKFTQYVSINFGRHIITSEMVQKGIQSNYIDAVMGHFQLGKEDQGQYSTFDNQDYIRSVRDVLEEIELEYFPNSLNIKDFLWT